MALTNQFDIEQLLLEAQHRWLRTPEICGSLFLFDRKIGSVDVLHCYYAHGEENENFQRRSYWMLEEELSHIVLVHYREVKGYRTNINRSKETEEAIMNAPEVEQIICNSEADSSMNSDLQQNSCQMLSQNTDSRSLNSGQASDYGDAESGSYQAKSTTSSLEIDEDRQSQKHQKELWGWQDVLESHNARVESASVKPSIFNGHSNSVHVIPKQENMLGKYFLTDPFRESQAFTDPSQCPEEWQVSADNAMHLGSACKMKDAITPKLHEYLATDSMCGDGQTMHGMGHLQTQSSVAACKKDISDVESNLTVEKKSSHFSATGILLDRSVKDKVLNKSDSFSRWMCKELGDVEPVMLSSGAYWDADDKRNNCPILPPAKLDSYTLSPSLAQEQIFRIADFAPNWSYAGSETKVLITGKFLKTHPDARKCRWSCMFGEVEVPAEVIADGVLRCYAPPHGVARVPFYVTCSNRLACSQVREFEYRNKFMHGFDMTSLSNRSDVLQIRFFNLLSLGSSYCENKLLSNRDSSSDLHHEITSLLKGSNSEWFQILELSSKEESSPSGVKDRLAEKLLKEKLCEWLLCKEAEGGYGPRGLDENGQGVLHFAAALGYDWAISPTIAAGVSINFRDVRGWTALHWAAYYGRERTVVYLISLGASPGALTDPTPTYPMGRTSADLASENGHKGIAGFLAESALSAHLKCLTLKEKLKQDSAVDSPGMTSVLTASERVPTQVSSGDDHGLSLKDSLAALCNATQAAARIHQVYRSHSFKRKQMREFGNDKMESEEYALSVITLKSHKQVHHDEPVHAAAIRIQNKFRGWKGRKEFLTLRQQIVKIQAHVRGHQVRKHYKKFVWSVGIMEKAILRWRRKRSGLRGFKSESLTVKPEFEGTSSKADDYDFLKEGRKQAEERLQKALSRVKSMVKYPEARDQYRRLLTTVTEIKEMKDGCSGAIDGPDAAASMDDDMVDLDTLLNDDTMP
ncbi:calmodulin-binding transcription activator 3 isoform X4 [Beta vulgaris subsp. vulgaris]|uniref:calmodulin-binding transcription activator 3 isoform X4 n=1 Tax=Beta vulgaris subsp. vulgaris TaxID=3555 RepID=UPI0020369F19|nr:calmodulin-binding transcription activator 3 isoform X4 [Beta vulgaris subsp. vulgaris]